MSQRGPRYQQLPLWRDATRLLLEMERAVRSFPRYHKYTLGSEMRRQAMAICRLDAYGPDARAIAAASRCSGRPVTRGGLANGLAWPLAQGARLRARLRRQRLAYCEIDEAGWLKGGMKRRQLRRLYPVPTHSNSAITGVTP